MVSRCVCVGGRGGGNWCGNRERSEGGIRIEESKWGDKEGERERERNRESERERVGDKEGEGDRERV